MIDWQQDMLESRDELLRILGLITVNFSGLEFTIRMFITRLMIKTRNSSDPREWAFQTELGLLLTAESGFFKVLTLLESLYKYSEQNPALVAELTNLVQTSG